MLKLVNYLRENNIDMLITVNALGKWLPSAIDVVFSREDELHMRFLVDTEAAGMSSVALEDMLLERCEAYVNAINKKENL